MLHALFLAAVVPLSAAAECQIPQGLALEDGLACLAEITTTTAFAKEQLAGTADYIESFDVFSTLAVDLLRVCGKSCLSMLASMVPVTVVAFLRQWPRSTSWVA